MKPSLQDFLDGEPLTYRNRLNKRNYEAVYRTGVGMFIYYKDKEICIASVKEDMLARAFYHNETRKEWE